MARKSSSADYAIGWDMSQRIVLARRGVKKQEVEWDDALPVVSKVTGRFPALKRREKFRRMLLG